jgi:hypothetical protein
MTYNQPTNDQFFEDSKNWFNNLNLTSKNQMVLTMYKLCLSTKDASHEKLIESLNSQWNDKLVKQLDVMKRLSMENEVLMKNQDLGINQVVNRLKDMEANLSNSVNGLSSKITPSANGKIGEDYIDQLLSKIPNASFTNITQTKGGGDFLLVLDNIQIMIESKNWTNSSIKGNPKEIENFRKTAIEAKEEKGISFAIMALHRVTDLKGKPMEIETEFTKKGALILLYVTNLFNHPERILYAIDAGILLLKQQSQHTINKDKFVYQINNFVNNIDFLEDSLKQRQKLIKDMTSLVKKDSEQLVNLKEILNNIINDTDQISAKDRLIKFYIELSKNGKVNKNMLEIKCLENKIPARVVREAGGIKVIKRMALEYLNKGKNDQESESESELESESNEIEESNETEESNE